MDDERYFTELACAFVRGHLGADADLARGLEAGLKLHKFKRNTELPRVRRVIGLLRALAPTTLLDVGSGRGTFLWPLLDAFVELPVTSIDRDPRRARDLGAVRLGGITRLTVARADAQHLPFADQSFDAVSLLEVLEHLPDPSAAAREALRVARRFVIVSVPSKEDDNPEHIHLFDHQSLAQLFPSRKVSFEHVLNHIIAIVRA
jgi:ubiquinone/menaquinone biosynthesis C-methylase UbiE